MSRLSVLSGWGQAREIASSSGLSRSEPAADYDAERELWTPRGRRNFLYLGLGAAVAAAFGVKPAPQPLAFHPNAVTMTMAEMEPGYLIRVGDEYMRIVAVDMNLVTVKRGHLVRDVTPHNSVLMLA